VKLLKCKNVSFLPPFINDLLSNELPNQHPRLTNHLHHINPIWQSANINGCGWFGDFLLQELLTTDTMDEKEAFGRGFNRDGYGSGVWVDL
jgi:hypothetical protein